MTEQELFVFFILAIIIYLVYNRNRLTELKNLTPSEFEEHCASWLEKQGYKTEQTRKTKDGNIDILVKNQSGKIIGVAECKRYTTKKAGVKEVRAFHSVMRGRKGWFFSLSGFSDDVKAEFVRKKNLKLIDGEELLK